MDKASIKPTHLKILVVGVLAKSLINFRWHLLKAMVDQGHQVITAAAAEDSLSGIDSVNVSEELAKLGIRHFPIPMNRSGLNPLADLKTLRALTKLCREEKPDLVLTYTAKAVVYGTFAAWICRVPKRVAMMTGLPFGLAPSNSRPTLGQRIAKELFKVAFKGCHTIIFQNPDDLNATKAIIPSNTKTALVNGSGVDLNYYQPAPLPNDYFQFLMIARLTKEKGVIEYLEASRQVKEKYPNVQFRLVGPLDPKGKENLEPILNQWVRDGIGEWTGPVSDSRTVLRECTVYVLPSYHEGTPRTVLEAMATGRPIITTDAPGCRETVEDGVNGLLVEPKSKDALANAMGNYLSMNEEQLTEMCRHSLSRCLNKFEATSTAKATLGFAVS